MTTNEKTLAQHAVRPAQRRRAEAYVGTPEDLVNEFRPAIPVNVLWPDQIAARAKEFLTKFPGHTMYAVKVNPDPSVIQMLYRAGIRRFDVASIEEVRLVARMAPKAKMYFMHTVKSREAIREAYSRYGVRAFVLDSEKELYKILQETDLAPDLELFIRMATDPVEKAVLQMSKKFGATQKETVNLMKLCRPVCRTLGIMFHVGWQCLEPAQYRKALKMCRQVVRESKIDLDVVDVGGGFPSRFPEAMPPSMDAYFDEIRDALVETGFDTIEVLCEPGQGLVAEAGALIARVELRKGDMLYLNDGTYGGLHDAGSEVGVRYPIRAVRPEGSFSKDTTLFRIAGPTCDTPDILTGKYPLPTDIDEGDWVVFDITGAYSAAIRSNFNGFGQAVTVLLRKPE